MIFNEYRHNKTAIILAVLLFYCYDSCFDLLTITLVGNHQVVDIMCTQNYIFDCRI